MVVRYWEEWVRASLTLGTDWTGVLVVVWRACGLFFLGVWARTAWRGGEVFSALERLVVVLVVVACFLPTLGKKGRYLKHLLLGREAPRWEEGRGWREMRARRKQQTNNDNALKLYLRSRSCPCPGLVLCCLVLPYSLWLFFGSVREKGERMIAGEREDQSKR